MQTYSIKASLRKKIAYIKNGDVVAELEALPDISETYLLGNGGPYHYIGSFVKWTKRDATLLISLDTQNKHLQSKHGHAARVFNTKKFSTSSQKIFLQLIAFFGVSKCLLRFKPTWLLCALSSGMPLAACFLAAKIYRIPFVHTRHMRIDNFRPSFLHKLRSAFDNWMIRKADAVLCNGPYLQDQLIKVGVPKKRIIQYGLPYTDIGSGPDPICESNKTSRNDCRLLYVGRIEEEKGVLDLLIACRSLLQNSHTASLTYIGHGQFFDELMHKTNEFGLDKKVFFLGHLQHPIALQTMRDYDILIVPTQQKLGEGRCKTIIEGLILGIPIIAPNYGAFRYLVQDGVNGLFYKPDNISDMSLKISHLIDNAAYRAKLGKNAKEMGKNLREPGKTFFQALEQAYLQTMHNKH